MPIPSLWLAALFAASLAHAAPQPPAFRLGDVATPIEYAASLAIDPREARFSGEVRITLRVNRATPLLWLNATNLAIESAAFQQGNRKIPVTIVPGGEDFVGFQANGADFVPGVALATIRYTGILEPVSTRGLFRQPEGGEWYVVSQFESISARRAFPCFDEPGWKTPWRLTIDAPAAEVVVSNTPETRASAAPARAGWTRHEFAPTKPLPSYLVALAIAPFDVIDGGTAGLKDPHAADFTPASAAAEKWSACQLSTVTPLTRAKRVPHGAPRGTRGRSRGRRAARGQPGGREERSVRRLRCHHLQQGRGGALDVRGALHPGALPPGRAQLPQAPRLGHRDFRGFFPRAR